MAKDKKAKIAPYLEVVEKEFSTTGHKKYVRYLDKVFNTKEYEDLIIKLRKECNIPYNGFSHDDGYIFPPPEWNSEPEMHEKIRKR
jgi:hypothetical protein